tara:strand:+ start:14363 stop:15097 length:735 start_codon:yes stop_codon:yes gene_type:complete
MSLQKLKIIIPARSGSKGMPSKNIKVFCSKSLLELSLEFACKINNGSIIISTDSKKYIEKIKSLNIYEENENNIFFHYRSDWAASDSSTDLDVVKDIVSSRLIDNSNIIAWLRPTSPLRSLSEFNNALKKFIQLGPNCAMMRSVKKSSTHPYWMKTKISDDFLLKPFIEKKDEKSFPNRQSLPDSYEISSEFDFAHVDQVLKQNTFFPNPMYGFETTLMPKVDIDSEEDFEIAKLIYLKMGAYS